MKHIEADVVLVGGGMSGLCAATQAQESLNATGGGSVVVFEKSGTCLLYTSDAADEL